MKMDLYFCLSIVAEDGERHHCGGLAASVLQEPHLGITNSQLRAARLLVSTSVQTPGRYLAQHLQSALHR